MNKLQGLNWTPFLLTSSVGLLYFLVQQTGIDALVLRLPIAMLLLLVAPGYAASVALFPQPSGGWAERWLLSLGLSIAIVVPGSLGMYWVSGTLSGTGWVMLCVGVALFFSIIAVVRTPDRSPTFFTIHLSRGRIAVAGISSTLILVAILIAIRGEQTYQTTFTQLWAVPAKDQPSGVISVGIRNFEGQSMTYELHILWEQETLYQRSDITLEAEEEQVFTITIEPPEPMTSHIQPVNIVLYHEADRNTVYRSVHIWPE